jgi:cystathionine beta-lyase/cystathionine gamma-synthase
MRAATEIVTGPERVDREAEPLTTPIYESTTFVFRTAEEVKDYNAGKSSRFLYSRYANPTVLAVEKSLAALEGADHALLLSSGMAATATALLALLQAGDEVVCSAAIYGGTLHLIEDLFPRYGIRGRFVEIEELREPEKVIGERTRLLWFESPINPTLRCVDVEAVGRACRARGVISVVDNTFASPINQQPLSLGIDLVMHSVTKYLNGHSDVTAGALCGSGPLMDQIEKARRLLGTILDPQAAYAIGRGLKTLDVRIQRHNANALAVAGWLQKDKRIARVYYPGLESHPDHALARRQMRGYGGMVCVDLGGGQDRAERFFDRLTVFKRAASLGGVESLCSLPVLTSQWGHSDDALARAGVTRSMARLSVGLEDPQDLIDDLDQALAKV